MTADKALESILGHERAATLRAALDRMIPGDDYPSACGAGVDAYLARQLAGDLADKVDTYGAGLNGLNSDAAIRFGRDFAGLTPEQQDDVLETFQGGSGAQFVGMLAAHAAEGYYGDPGNCGNRDCAAWAMVGFDQRWTVGEGEADS
jgi:hypothetical protein